MMPVLSVSQSFAVGKTPVLGGVGKSTAT